MDVPTEPGTVLLGKYRIEHVLGEGGMGIVVAAMHLHLDQRVAIKFLKTAALENPDVVTRFAREARAAVKIQSEHVARVLDVGTLEGGAPFMVMEYLDGTDLTGVLRQNGALRVDAAVDFILQACEAIAEAHALGIVHRDLKPQNLFLAHRADGSRVVKVLDFGISKGGGADAAMTQTTAVMGSPLYMSPEQLRSSRQVDARSDIWSIGIILHELLSGDVPFTAETMPQLCGVILSEPPPPLRTIVPNAPQGIEDIVLRCLDKDPSKRFYSLFELAKALAPFGSQEAQASASRIARVLRASARPPAASLSGVEAQAAVAPAPPGATQSTSTAWGGTGGTPTTVTATPGESPRKTSPALIAGIAALAVVGALAGVMFLRGGQAAPAAPTAAESPTIHVAPATPSGPVVTPSELVELKISATPATAKLYLDDAELPSNPYAARVRGDGSSHRARAEAPGHVTKTSFVVFEPGKQLDLALDLENQASSKPGAASQPAPRRETSPTLPKAPHRTIDTSDPFK